jgi:hypothetical protein
MRTAANALAAGGRLGEQVRQFPSTIPRPLSLTASILKDGIPAIDFPRFESRAGFCTRYPLGCGWPGHRKRRRAKAN